MLKLSAPTSINAAVEANLYYKAKLREEFSKRAEKNPRYSLRAFAKTLRVDAASLSKVFSGQMVPSWKVAHSVLAALEFSQEEKNRFLGSIAEAHRARNLQRLNPMVRNFRYELESSPTSVSVDDFAVVSDWYHFAILELALTKDFKRDTNWIARQLGINVMEAKIALDRLIGLGFLVDEAGVLKRAHAKLAFNNGGATSQAQRKRIRQVLDKASSSIEADPLAKRSHSSVCLAIDPDKIPEAKARIQKFLEEMAAFLECGEQTRVYEMSVALFPLQVEVADF